MIAGDPAKSNLLRYIDLPEGDAKHMPPKGKTQVSDDERLILNWWVEAGAPENTPVGELTPPDDVQLAMERNVPPAIRAKQEAAKREKVARLAGIVAGLQKRVPGTLRAIAPGETDLEFSAALEPGRFGDAQLQDLAAVGDDLVLLDLRRTNVTDAGLADPREDAPPAAAATSRNKSHRRGFKEYRSLGRSPGSEPVRHPRHRRGRARAWNDEEIATPLPLAHGRDGRGRSETARHAPETRNREGGPDPQAADGRSDRLPRAESRVHSRPPARRALCR